MPRLDSNNMWRGVCPHRLTVAVHQQPYDLAQLFSLVVAPIIAAPSVLPPPSIAPVSILGADQINVPPLDLQRPRLAPAAHQMERQTAAPVWYPASLVTRPYQ